MSRTSSNNTTAPVNYAQAASKARSGTTTPSAVSSPVIPAGPLKPNSAAVNGVHSGTVTPAGSDRGDGVTIPKQPAGMAQPSINFGTLNDASAPLSSSPAQPATFASHLQPGNKLAFGSIASGNATPSPASTPAAVAPKPAASPAPAAAKKVDFNSFFQGGGAVSAPNPGSATAAPATVVTAPTSSNGGATAAPPSLPAEHQRRPSTYDASNASSAHSSPRPPSAILAQPGFSGAPATPHYHQPSLGGAARPFSPAAPIPTFNPASIVYQPGQYAQQQKGYPSMPQHMPNGAQRQQPNPAYGSPSPSGARPGAQRFGSSQAPTSPRMPSSSLPSQANPYGYPQGQQWSHYQAYPGYGYSPGYPYPAAPSPYFAQAQAGQQPTPSTPQPQSTPSLNGSQTPSTMRASTVSPTPSSVSSVPAASTPAPPSSAADSGHASRLSINPAASAFNPMRDFVPAKRESKAILIRPPPATAAKPAKPTATPVKAPAATTSPAPDSAAAVPPPAIPKAEETKVEETVIAAKAVEEAKAKADAEAAEIETERKAKEAREAEQAEKERAAKQAAEAAEAAKVEAKRRADEEAATEAARLEKLRLDDEADKAKVEQQAKDDAAERERVVAAEAKAKEAAAVAEATPAEPKEPALVDASAPAPKLETMPAIAEAVNGDQTDSQAASALPSRAATPPADDDDEETGKRPARLELKIAQDGPSALSTATPLRDLTNISYPEGYSKPSPQLNATAAAGKFRYDREFLLQFQDLCRTKPEGMPSAEALGMTDALDGMAGAQTPRGGGFGPLRGRGAPGGGGFGGRQPSMSNLPPRAGGNMQMGNFAAPPPKTSEGRFAQATNNMAMGGAFGAGFGKGPMLRTPSGMQPPSRTSSKRGDKRVPAGPGGRGAPPQSSTVGPNGEYVAPLVKTENAWADNFAGKRGGNADPTSPEMVQRKVKALLNKLTMDKFDSISDQIINDWAQKSKDETDGRILRQVIQLIFEKATDEAAWSAMYAKLCRKLQDLISPDIRDESLLDANQQPVAGGLLFRKYLLNRCQEDFEKGWAQKESATAAAASKASEDNKKKTANEQAEAAAAESGKEPQKEAELLSDEYYIAQKAKRQGLGLVKFIGELFKLQMLTPRIMHECVVRLLSGASPEEEDLESLCRLLTTVGPLLDDASAKSQNAMTIYFDRLKTMQKNEEISSRIRFMIQDLIELKQHKWRGRVDATGPKTIQEIHADAARQQAEEARRVASGGRGLPVMRDQMARGGSRPGQQRGGPAGADGWSTIGGGPAPTPAARPSKAGDLGRFGNVRQPQPSNAGTFGPSGIFNKRNNASPAPAPDTPTARQNAFAALEETPEPDGEPTTPTSRRPQLKLAPRTLPVEGEAATPDEGEAQTEDAGEPAVDKAQIQRTIENSIKEFFELKDQTEAVTACKDLPVDAKRDFVKGLALKVIDAREEKVDLLCELFQRFIDDEAMPGSEIAEGLEPVLVDLDDLSADAPKAFPFAVKLLRTTDVSEEDIVRLSAGMQSIEGDDEDERQAVRDRLLKEWRKQAAAES